jgi:HEAT repeat protein
MNISIGEYLGKIGDERAVEPLIQALKDGDQTGKVVAETSLELIKERKKAEMGIFDRLLGKKR